MAKPVDVKDVQLGEQPNHAEPPTHEEMKEAHETNLPIVLGYWKELNDLLGQVLEKTKVGSDPEAVQLRSYAQVQKRTTDIKIENLTNMVGK